MKITDIKIEKLDIKLSKPFSYFTATLDKLPYALITIKTDEKISGIGEAALAWDVTGETQIGALEIMKYLKPTIINKSLKNIDDAWKIIREMNKYIKGNPGLKSGVEMALLDVLGKYKNKPIYKLFKYKKLKYIIPQKVLSFEEQQSKSLGKIIKQAEDKGIKIFKAKLGKGKKEDIDSVKKICAVSPGINLVLDINQGWENAKNSITIIKKIEKYNILWIEQPTHFRDYEGLAEIKKNTKIPIMADESCHDLLDLENLHKRKAVDMVNIKIAKCGGILKAIEMIEYCEKNKIKYMLGDMINSSIGTAANIHLATIGNFASFDLTLPDRIKDDPGSGIKIKDYKFFIPEKPGLGIKTK